MKHNCDLCGSSDSTPIEAARPYIGDNDPPVVCGSCGFIYVSERRTPEEVAAAWDDIWGAGYTSAWPAVKARLTYVAEWIDQNIGFGAKSVLDIGAGEGTFLRIAEEYSLAPDSLCAIEPFEKNADRIQTEGFNCFHGTIEEATFQKELFDIVTVLWTLENTGDCIGFLKKAREFLKPDGHLVVATGSRILVPYKKPLCTYFSDNPADTHCFRFSARTLKIALIKAGLHPDQCNRFNDSDWLVMAADLGPNAADHPPSRDDPDEVLQFFNNWGRLFP